MENAAALGAARAARSSHATLALAANVGGDASLLLRAAKTVCDAALGRLESLADADDGAALPLARPLEVRRRRRVGASDGARGGSLGLTPNAVLGVARRREGARGGRRRGQRVPGRDERMEARTLAAAALGVLGGDAEDPAARAAAVVGAR